MGTATATLDRILTPVIQPVVDLAVYVLTEYWPFLLVIVVAGALIAKFTKFAHFGSK
jgi:hypothetical protein